MVLRWPKIILFVILSLPAVKGGFAQGLKVDTVNNSKEIEAAIAWHDHYFSGDNNPLYDGYEYIPYNLIATGTPYFHSAQWAKGSVFYENKWYRGVPLLFDIMQGKLVIPGSDGITRIALMNEGVKQFLIYGRLFVRVSSDQGSKYNGLHGGFYEILVQGKTALVVRRTKDVTDPSVQGERKFYEKDFFYIEKGGTYYPIKKKRELLQVYSDQHKKIKRFIRENGMKYAKNPEAVLISVTKYYNKGMK